MGNERVWMVDRFDPAGRASENRSRRSPRLNVSDRLCGVAIRRIKNVSETAARSSPPWLAPPLADGFNPTIVSIPLGAAPPPSYPKVEQLPPEVQELLQELALAVHKRGIYPASHPMLHGSMDALTRCFQSVLSNRSQLSLGVSRHRLVVDGVATDENNALLADFAERLYEHELGVVTFLANVQRTTIDEFIGAVSASPARGAEPLGAGGRSQLARWNDLVLTGVAFDRLELMGDERAESEREQPKARRPAELWLGLARAALAGGSLDGALEDPKQLAESIERQVNREGYDAAILGLLRQIIGELDDGETRDALLQQRVSDLVQNLDDATLSKLLHMGGDAKAGAAFLERACESLTAAAVVRLTRVAVSDVGVPIAGAMLRLLTKLARDADSRRITSRSVDRALRTVIRKMLADWNLVDPNPEAYTVVLDGLATNGIEPQADLGRDVCEAERILQIGVATDSIGPSVEAALARLIASNGVAAAVDCLIACDPSPLRDSLVDRLINESTFREELSLDRPAVPVLQHAVDRLGARAVGALAQELERRGDGDAVWIADLLTRIGEDGIPAMGETLSTLAPRALRHMIVVFDRCDAWPVTSDPLEYARHSDPTVRRETFRYVLKRDATRDRGILAGLRDPDVRIFNLALGAISGACAIEVARGVMSRLESPVLSDELRARGIRALGDTQYDEVRVWLEKRATATHWLFRTVRLRKPSLELYAIVTALATQNADRPESRRILALARRSRNPYLRRAATARSAAQAQP